MKIALIGYGKMGKMIEQIAIVKVVSGSTGWMKDHGDEVRRLCTEGGRTLFWASNFSIGVAIFSAVNRYLAKIMNQFPQYDVEMEETHHVHKLDHPSGTAITLAEEIVENIDRKEAWAEETTDPNTTRMPTSSPSATMPIRARASPWEQCWQPNTPPNTTVCSPFRTCLISR